MLGGDYHRTSIQFTGASSAGQINNAFSFMTLSVEEQKGPKFTGGGKGPCLCCVLAAPQRKLGGCSKTVAIEGPSDELCDPAMLACKF